MEPSDLLSVLADWNYWDRTIPKDVLGHPRELVDTIREVATGREIVALTGIRRCGKTTILLQLLGTLLEQGLDPRRILYVNFEDHRLDRDLGAALLDDLVSCHTREVHPEGPTHIFLDEIHEVPGWERWLRGLYDRRPDLRFHITGSSSSMMASELSSLLTGRNLTFRAAPFSYREYLTWHGVEVARHSGAREAHRCNIHRADMLLHHLNNYLEFGGFPEALKSPEEPRRVLILQQYYNDILARDVVRRHELRKPRLLEALASVLLDTISNQVSYGKLGNALGTSASSIRRMMGFLEEAELIGTTHYFAHSTRASISVQQPRKVYAADTGLRNAVIRRRTADRGWLAESLVYGRLVAAGHQPMWWRDKAEVDFVIGPPITVPVNVTYGTEVPDRELQSLHSFHQRFGNQSALLITENTWGRSELGACTCHLCPLWAFLLADNPLPSREAPRPRGPGSADYLYRPNGFAPQFDRIPDSL